MLNEVVELGLLRDDPADANHRRFINFVMLDAFVYPDAPLHRLDVGGAFNQWLHFIDDQYDDHEQVGNDPAAVRAIMERAIGILETGVLPPEPSPFDRITHRLYQRLAALASEAWMRRFLKDVRDYLLGGSLVVLERWGAVGLVPTVAEYLPVRLFDSSVLTVFDVMELIDEVDLPPEIFEHPRLQTMRLAAAYHIILVNDMVSYYKEIVERQRVCNLVHVLMVEQGLTLKQALLDVKARVDQELDRFLEAEAMLGRELELTPDLVRYTEGLKKWISGNIDFSLSSARFRWPL